MYELWFNVRLQLDFYKSVTIVVPSPPQGGLFLAVDVESRCKR
ncbi:MAG: hypothetical protein JWN42_1550 [Candidatus Angelobacter sp.]|nr:hypothetical protein [Candidatus Angelobacter sp.]